MPPVLAKHRRAVSGVLPADGPDPNYIQPTSDYGDSHVLGGATADRQAMLSKPDEADQAIWDWLDYSDSSILVANQTGGALVQGDVVVFANAGAVGLDDTLSSQNHFAVCAEATLADTVTGRFWASAVIPVVKNEGSVTALHYLRKSATTKAVEDTGVAAGPTVQVPSGALGLALSAAAGDGFVSALWFTRPAPLLPPLTAGYVKGTGTGYAVQATPLPITDFATGTPTGAKFLRDDGVLALPPGGGGTDPILDRVTTDVLASNTTTEITLYSFNVLGGTLGTTKRLRWTPMFTYNQADFLGGTVTLTFRFKWGGITRFTVVIQTEEGGVRAGSTPLLEVWISAAGSAGSQVLRLMLFNAFSVVSAAVVSAETIQDATVTLDSAVDQTFAVTAQWNASSGHLTARRGHAVLELL